MKNLKFKKLTNQEMKNLKGGKGDEKGKGSVNVEKQVFRQSFGQQMGVRS